MVRSLLFLFLFAFFTKPAEAFVFSFTNKGIEWGWEGEKHFKFYQSIVVFRTSNIDKTKYFAAHGSMYFRWLKLTINSINLNFSSGLGMSVRKSDFSTGDFNDYTDLCPHLTALAIEPEFLFNERYSLFLRLPVLQCSEHGWSAYGQIQTGFIAHINVGISINFKGKKNIDPNPR